SQHLKSSIAQLQRYDTADVRFIIGHENRLAVLRHLLSACRPKVPLSLERTFTAASIGQFQFESEHASLTELAFDKDPSTMDGLNNVLHQRQSKTGARSHPAIRLRPIELIENKRQVLGSNPDACIDYFCQHFALGLINSRFNRDRATNRRVFDGIAEQI